MDLNATGPVKLDISPRRTLLQLWAVILLLMLAGFASLVSRHHLGHDQLMGLVPLFDLDSENSIPTLFNSLLMLLIAALLAMIARARKQRRQTCLLWIFLALVFLFLGIDESASIHERLNRPVREWLNTSGAFLFAWIIPYGVLVLLLGVTYARFVLDMPSRPRRLLILAFSMYIAGAIGVEMIGALYYEANRGDMDFTYGLITLVEEFLEMGGLATFVYCLMVYIDSVENGITVRFGTGGSEPR